MAVRFRYALHTDLGTVRTNNEDSAFASDHLLVLADGMGGHAAGEVASTVAMRVFAELGSEDTPGADQILAAGRHTRRALHSMSEADPILESMGTTLLAVASDGEHVRVGHIGDSRVYALREGSLYQVTTDHTHVQRLIDTGQLTPEQARTHPYRSMLLKSLDDQPTGADLDIIDVDFTPGDRLLLCSDGLSDYLAPEQIGALLTEPDREESARSLVQAALSAGTRDNVTVVVADLEEVPDSEASAEVQHPLVVGAASEAIGLSGEAAAALRATMPALAIDSTSPMADCEHPPGAHNDLGSETPAPELAPNEGATTSDGEALAQEAPPSAAGSDQAGQNSRVPGVLAALAVLAIAAALSLILS